MTTPLGPQTKLESPERGGHADSHYPPPPRDRTRMPGGMLHDATCPGHPLSPLPHPFSSVLLSKAGLAFRSWWRAGMVGSIASDCVVPGPGCHPGRRTPDPAGRLPEQPTPGLTFPYKFKPPPNADISLKSVFLLCGRREAWPKDRPAPPFTLCPWEACLMGYDLLPFIFAGLPWEPEL